MFCKDRVKRFRSLYTQWPTQSGVLYRIFAFKEEAKKYSDTFRIASYGGDMLPKKADFKPIPCYFCAICNLITINISGLLALHFQGENFLRFCDVTAKVFSTLFQEVGVRACSAK